MSKAERQLEEDRRLRDAAKALFQNEVEHAKRVYGPAALSGRLAVKAGDTWTTASTQTSSFARRHTSTVAAAGLAAAGTFGLWLVRKPVLSGLAALASRCKSSPDKRVGESRVDDARNEEADDD